MTEYEVETFNSPDIKNEFPDYVLGIDIGGTNTNSGVAEIKNKKPKLLFSLNFKSQELQTIIPAINQTLDYAKDNYDIKIEHACVGAAGVVSPDQKYADLTNIRLDVNTDEIIGKTDLKSAFIINDFQAIGYGINMLNDKNSDDLLMVKEGNKEAGFHNNTKAIIGAGTGLGKTILTYNDNLNAYIPLPCEGGHADFPAQNDFELKLLSFLKKLRNIHETVCYEELLSGRGIEAIYLFLKAQSFGEQNKYSEEIEKAEDKAALISEYRNVDETCKETFRLFTKFYGRCAKNFVLDTLAIDGLYIAGGIASKNKEIFSTKDFIDEFLNVYQRRDVLEQTPIYVIMNYYVGLYGACFAAMYYFQK